MIYALSRHLVGLPQGIRKLSPIAMSGPSGSPTAKAGVRSASLPPDREALAEASPDRSMYAGFLVARYPAG